MTDDQANTTSAEGRAKDNTAAQPSDADGGRRQDGNPNTGSNAGNNQGGQSRRRRGSRGGRNRKRNDAQGGAQSKGGDQPAPSQTPPRVQLPANPKIGDTISLPPTPATDATSGTSSSGGRSNDAQRNSGGQANQAGDGNRKRRRRGGRRRGGSKSGGGQDGQSTPVEALVTDDPIELDEETLARRRGRQRQGRPIGRYMMAVHVEPEATQIAILEGRAVVEHYVSRPADDVSEIHGNIYLGKVQNVLPGMEAAFVDIGTPKNAVLYRGDVAYDPDDVEKGAPPPRIEDVLKAKQSILCQVTKNPIAHKGARLTQEISLPGRFVVLVPNSKTYGISKRLPDKERKRLRNALDRVKPAEHGVIVRTAAENVTSEEIERDVRRLLTQWEQIEKLAASSKAPSLLYREPEMAVRVIREEFNKDYRAVYIDDPKLYEDVNDYVSNITPALADRLEYYDPSTEKLPLFERHHIQEQLVKALDKKVWLPGGGSLIIESTEALTVIDVNTGKNVGKSSLEETVTRNNVEAAKEIPRQLRLRDIGGIIVIDFVDMEERKNRDETMRAFREALAHDKTRTQVFDISELGLVQMTRKRIGEGLLESFSTQCDTCEGRGVELNHALMGE